MANVKRKRWSFLVLGAGAVVVLVLFVTGAVPVPGSHQHKPEEKAAAKPITPVAVTVAQVTLRPIQRQVLAVGTLYGFEEVTVTPKIEGVVTRLLHDVGDFVKPGEALLEIEETYYRLAVIEAERALELELAKIGLRKLPEGELRIDIVPMVAKAKAEEANARSRATRTKELQATNAVAQQELENAISDLAVAVAKREHAELEALATLASSRHKHAMLETARRKFEETKVRAPEPSKERFRHSKLDVAAAGLTELAKREPHYVVAQRLVAEGEMVRAFPSIAVFRLVIDQPLKLLAPIPEHHSGEIKIGQTVQVQVEAYPTEIFTGVISRINPVVDRTSRTIQVEILLPNEDRRLKCGGFCRLAIATQVDAQSATVPEEALVTFAGVTRVFTVVDGKAKSVIIQPGIRVDVPGPTRTETWVEVAPPLKGQVVTSGQSKLADGTPVRIRQ